MDFLTFLPSSISNLLGEFSALSTGSNVAGQAFMVISVIKLLNSIHENMEKGDNLKEATRKAGLKLTSEKAKFFGDLIGEFHPGVTAQIIKKALLKGSKELEKMSKMSEAEARAMGDVGIDIPKEKKPRIQPKMDKQIRDRLVKIRKDTLSQQKRTKFSHPRFKEEEKPHIETLTDEEMSQIPQIHFGGGQDVSVIPGKKPSDTIVPGLKPNDKHEGIFPAVSKDVMLDLRDQDKIIRSLAKPPLDQPIGKIQVSPRLTKKQISSVLRQFIRIIKKIDSIEKDKNISKYEKESRISVLLEKLDTLKKVSVLTPTIKAIINSVFKKKTNLQLIIKILENL